MKELVEIQKAIKVPKSEKNEIVGFQYRTAERILSIVRPLYIERGCTLTLSDTIEPMPNGAVYIKATVTLTNGAGESVSTTAYAQQGTLHKGIDYPQLTGAASSYARKYALCGLFAIDDSRNDPDTNQATRAREEAKAAEYKERIETAKAEALRCLTTNDLLVVWNKYPDLQNDQAFSAVCTQQKQAIR